MLLLWVGLSAWTIPACGEDAARSHLVVGVTSDLRGGVDIDRLEIEMIVGDTVIHTSATPVDERTFPLELEFVDVEPGESLTLRLVSHLGAAKRVVRTMTTPAAPDGERRVLRLHLEQACDLAGPSPAPTCDEIDTTCVGGACQSAWMPAAAQRPYTPDWMKGPDGCKPGGAPEVIVGKGQSDFFPAVDGEVAQVEAGPQGGHHIWISARVRNLGRSGSITEVGGEIPSLGLSLTPLKVVFTLDTDEGGWCKIFGLRFQLDVAQDIEPMLGEPVEVYVKIVDVDGAEATDTQWFTLSSDIL